MLGLGNYAPLKCPSLPPEESGEHRVLNPGSLNFGNIGPRLMEQLAKFCMQHSTKFLDFFLTASAQQAIA